MSNKLIEMYKLRQIIRLHSQGSGPRTISWMLKLSRNTIKKYLGIWHELDLSLQDFLDKTDAELSILFSTKPLAPLPNARIDDLETFISDHSPAIRKKIKTRQMLHNEYLEKYPEGYCIAQFNRTICMHLALSRPVMHLEHKPGDKMYIDFAGKKLQIIQSDGSSQNVEVFVAILGCSQLTYVEAVYSQKREDFIKACENTLHYYGGVPQVIVPDNLRSAVTKGSRYEAVINEEFASFAEHYDLIVIPARVYKPRDKSLVEGAVKLIYRSIYARLEGCKFYDLESLNAAIHSALEIHNTQPFSSRTYSRRDQFENIERETLSPLNPIRYQMKQQVMVTVMRNGYVRLGDDVHYYSVPYKYIGKKVKVLYTADRIDMYYYYEPIASHKRDPRRYHYTTNTDHLAPQHKYLSEWSPEKFITKAEDIHEDVANYIGKVLEHNSYPEQAYKLCSGILSFGAKVGVDRLTAACRCADKLGQYNYLIIDEILRKKLDKIQYEDESVDIPTHKNIRGKEYYQ